MWRDYLTFQLLSDGPDERAGTRDDVSITRQPEIKERRGWFDRAIGGIEDALMAPMAQMKAGMVRSAEDREIVTEAGAGPAVGDKKQVRIRQYFPETLFLIRPS